MNKAFVKHGLLGIVAVAILTLAVLATLIRPAQAQGNSPRLVGIICEPMQLASENGQRITANTYVYTRGSQPCDAETTFDIELRGHGPTGPISVRTVAMHRHRMNPKGGVAQIAIVQNGDTFDLYEGDTLMSSLSGLPPGIPIEDTLVKVHTTWGHLENGAIYGGSVEVENAAREIKVRKKSGELTGNVILIK